MKIGGKLAAGFGSILLIFALVGAIAYRSTLSLVETSVEVRHTYQVRGLLRNLVQDLVDAESRQRGYLLTENEFYLDRFDTTLEVLDGHLRSLASLASEHADHRPLVEILGPLVAEKRAQLTTSVELGRKGEFLQAVRLVKTRAGKQTMDHIRSLVDEALAGEARVLEGNEARARESASRALAVVAWGIGLALLLSGVIGLAISSGIARSVGGLVEATERLAAGDLQHRVAVATSDEMGLLAAAFNRMAEEQEEGLKRREEERANAEDRLEAEVRLRTSELEATNAELESFAYTVAHDLKAPLRGINGFATILANEERDRLSPAGWRSLERVREASARGGELIEALLRLASLSRVDLRRRPVDLTAAARSIEGSLDAGGRHGTVDWQIDRGLVADADPGLAEEVLRQLLGNSWKFTSRKEKARIEVGKLVEGVEEVFFVRDDGAGFDMAHKAQLFGAFHRAHTEDEFPGLGVGLAITEKIIRRHGGRLWAEGKRDRGATFYFTFGPPPGPGPGPGVAPRASR